MNRREIKKWWINTRDTWLGTIIYMILGFIIAYTFYAGLGFALDTDTPVTAVMSGSMEPVMYKGDMIFVRGSSEYQVGDIIVFNTNMFGYPVIHRIVENNDGNIRTRGDNNGGIDPWTIKKSNIHGKVMFKLPYLGWVKVIFSEIIMSVN